MILQNSFKKDSTDEYFTCEAPVYHLGFYGFSCQHTMAKYVTQNQNMICIRGRDCNLFPSSWGRGGYFKYHVVDKIYDAHLTDV